jgi:sugar phosphate isomerase/epimerase
MKKYSDFDRQLCIIKARREPRLVEILQLEQQGMTMDDFDNSRRNLLKAMGLGRVASAFPSGPSLNAKPKARIGVQLYTVRKALEHDFEGTMRKIAKIGFVGIETYALPEKITPHHASKVFMNVGLKVLGMHTELPVGKQRDPVLRMAETYHCERVIYAGWPEAEKYESIEATKRMVELYNETADFLKTQGLSFGLHNHWWEFEKKEGIYPFYYLLEHLDKAIFFEIDTYWTKTAGLDPAHVVRDFGTRAPLLHIKDGPANKGDDVYRQVPAGEGVIDFPVIVKAGGENIEWMIVEFDEYEKDIFEGLRQSYTFLTTNGLAVGKV